MTIDVFICDRSPHEGDERAFRAGSRSATDTRRGAFGILLAPSCFHGSAVLPAVQKFSQGANVCFLVFDQRLKGFDIGRRRTFTSAAAPVQFAPFFELVAQAAKDILDQRPGQAFVMFVSRFEVHSGEVQVRDLLSSLGCYSVLECQEGMVFIPYLNQRRIESQEEILQALSNVPPPAATRQRPDSASKPVQVVRLTLHIMGSDGKLICPSLTFVDMSEVDQRAFDLTSNQLTAITTFGANAATTCLFLSPPEHSDAAQLMLDRLNGMTELAGSPVPCVPRTPKELSGAYLRWIETLRSQGRTAVPDALAAEVQRLETLWHSLEDRMRPRSQSPAFQFSPAASPSPMPSDFSQHPARTAAASSYAPPPPLPSMTTPSTHGPTSSVTRRTSPRRSRSRTPPPAIRQQSHTGTNGWGHDFVPAGGDNFHTTAGSSRSMSESRQSNTSTCCDGGNIAAIVCLQGEVDRLRKERNEWRDKVETLEKKNKDLKDGKSEAKKQQALNSKEIKHLKKDLADSMQKLAEVTKLNTDLSAANAQLTKEKEDLATKLKDALKEKTNLTEQVSKLQNDLAEEKRLIQQAVQKGAQDFLKCAPEIPAFDEMAVPKRKSIAMPPQPSAPAAQHPTHQTARKRPLSDAQSASTPSGGRSVSITSPAGSDEAPTKKPKSQGVDKKKPHAATARRTYKKTPSLGAASHRSPAAKQAKKPSAARPPAQSDGDNVNNEVMCVSGKALSDKEAFVKSVKNPQGTYQDLLISILYETNQPMSHGNLMTELHRLNNRLAYKLDATRISTFLKDLRKNIKTSSSSSGDAATQPQIVFDPISEAFELAPGHPTPKSCEAAVSFANMASTAYDILSSEEGLTVDEAIARIVAKDKELEAEDVGHWIQLRCRAKQLTLVNGKLSLAATRRTQDERAPASAPTPASHSDALSFQGLLQQAVTAGCAITFTPMGLSQAHGIAARQHTPMPQQVVPTRAQDVVPQAMSFSSPSGGSLGSAHLTLSNEGSHDQQ